jgi:hypothetical protein
VAQGLSMDLSAHNYGTSMLDMELTSSEHRGIMMLESEESAEARAPRAPRGPRLSRRSRRSVGASGAMTPGRLSRRGHPSGQVELWRRHSGQPGPAGPAGFWAVCRPE